MSLKPFALLGVLLLAGCVAAGGVVAAQPGDMGGWKPTAYWTVALASAGSFALSVWGQFFGPKTVTAENLEKASKSLAREIKKAGTDAHMRDIAASRERSEQNEKLDRLLASVENPGVPEEWLIEMAQLIDRDIDNLEEAKAEFEATLPDLVKLRDAPERASNLDKDLEAILEKVRQQSLAEGRKTLEATLADYDNELDEDKRAQREQERLLVLDTLIESLTALRDPEEVAKLEMRKIVLTLPEEERFQAARSVQDVYDKRGQTYGARIDLRIAAALARAYGQTDNPEQWANAKNDLGIALKALGERGEKGALQDAVAAYHAALEIYTREAAPMDWAMTQNNLGIVLRVLGERGEEGALQDAVGAYRAALEVRTREAAPMQWAMTQNNLGTVLEVLGSRGEEGALQDAITAYRAALEVRTREAAPMDWAMTQNNLGTVLEVLGSRGEEGALQDAVAAYRAALEVHTREAAPMDWAMTQNNLGNALQVLGKRGEEGALQDAVAAYRAALEVHTRDATSMDWAMTQNNLGNALGVLGERGEEGALQDAVGA
ncbi:MAG: hypothetical protein AAGK66_12275, partial [Pseudomonadota bacterium]